VKVLLVGATGGLGAAVGETLTGRGHQVVTVGRTAGDVRADVADPGQTARVLAEVGGLDAVASAAGDVPYERIVDMTPEDYLRAYRGKVAAQIELVRQGTRHVAERGSFTLIAGVLNRDPIVTGSAAAMANGAVESFVRAAAIEIAPQRVNAVSPPSSPRAWPSTAISSPGSRPSVWTWRPRPTSGPSRVPRPARCSACSDRAPGPSAGPAGTREDGPVPALRGRAARLGAGRRRRR
jgi:NAD(P)-dependent dehydrogenase (short-subunit alcohol dehydrogenase family)